MPSYLEQGVYLVISLALTRSTIATPRVAFPINSQVPPVAYVSQPFDFTFSPTTFSSDLSEISYALSNQPGWLSLDGVDRRLSGTPIFNDVGASNFEVVATDIDGQTSSNVTLVVLGQQTLSSSTAGVLSQLATAGSVSVPSTLLLYPQQTFQFSLSSSSFEGASAETAFYAVSSDGSPLPSWLQFDPESIQFSGTTPPLLSPSSSQQVFSFNLAASNVIGFFEAKIQFEILISDRLLAFAKSAFNYTTSLGTFLEIPSLLEQLTIDGSIVRGNQIASAVADYPSWLQFNSSDLSFSGMVPDNFENSEFLLEARSFGANTANVTIQISLDGRRSVFQNNLGTVLVDSGSYFMYTVNTSSMFSQTDVNVSTLGLPDWLSFNQANLTIQGLVPSGVDPETRVISFIFNSASNSNVANLTLTVRELSATTTAPVTTTSTTSSVSVGNRKATSTRHVTLVLAIVLPVIAVVFLALIVLAIVQKRKKQKRGQPDKISSENDSRTAMPQPEPGECEVLALPGSALPNEGVPQDEDNIPQLELLWAPDSHRQTRKRLSKRLRSSNSSIVGSSWDDLIDFRAQSKDCMSLKQAGLSPFQQYSGGVALASPPELQVSCEPSVRPVSEAIQRQPRGNRDLQSWQSSTKEATGLPNKLRGAGHGTGTGRTLANPDSRSSWQTTLGTIPAFDSRPSTVVMSSFPVPPSQTSVRALASTSESLPWHKTNPQPTLRLVESDSEGSRSLEGARQNYHTQKARQQLEGTARYFSTTSRTSSIPAILRDRARLPIQGAVIDTARIGPGDEELFTPPPIPHRSRARQGPGRVLSLESRPQHLSNTSATNRNMSIASSHQFDSAISSDSQWEDENVVLGENAAGEMYWQTQARSSDSRLSPFELNKLYRGAEHEIPDSRIVSESHRPRLDDQRKHVNVEGAQLQRSQISQQGSFRFI